MPSKRRGKLCISAELYDSNEIDDALSALKVKVYDIKFNVFSEIYEIYFTSVFLEEVGVAEIPPQYTIFREDGKYSFQKV